jgi:hypothetical protein
VEPEKITKRYSKKTAQIIADKSKLKQYVTKRKSSEGFLLVDLSKHAFINLNKKQKEIPKKVRDRGRNCRVYKIPYKNKQRDRVVLLVKCKEDYSLAKGHLVYLRLKPIFIKNNLVSDSKSILNIPMKIYCKCPFFLYYGVQYNATRGKYLMAGVERENRKPDIRDPKRENTLCKHLSAVRDSLQGQTVKKAMKGNKIKASKHDETQNFLDFRMLFDDYPLVSIEEATMTLRSYVKEDIPFVNEDNFYDVIKSYGVFDE